MTQFSVLPTALVEKLLDMAIISSCNESERMICAEVSVLLNMNAHDEPHAEGVYQDFFRICSLLRVTDFTRDESGAFVDAHTSLAFERYCDMHVLGGQELLAVKNQSNEFFRALGLTSTSLNPAPETAEAFERVFDLLSRLDPSMPLEQVMAWLREFLSGSLDADVALTAAEGQWIPVSEGLPPSGILLILSDVERQPAKRLGQAAPIKIGYLENGKWKLFGASWTPSHWRLMPPPVVVHPDTVIAQLATDSIN